MAAIGKIRSWGPILVCIIGLALFAFIAEELVRSCNSGNQAEARRVGVVLGQKIDIDDFNKLVDEYKNVKKANGQDENLTDQDYDQIWQSYVSNAIFQNEAQKLGLTVTDEELQNVLKEGTNPMLARSPFVNQQTGRFDANELKKFLDYYNKGQFQSAQEAEYYQVINKFWLFLERSLREQLLAEKYQGLFAHCFLTNAVEAQMSFKEENEEANIQLAAFPYSNVKESEAKVTDEDMKAKYNELKELFRINSEIREAKMVAVQILASEADRKALNAEMTKYAAALDSVQDPSDLVHQANSAVHFLNVPLAKESFPMDIQAQLDSVAVGKATKVFESKMDNSLNTFRVMSKVSLPDSIQYRMIQVSAADVETTRAKADSVYNAIKGGANFADIAKKYGQSGDSLWVAKDQYVRDPQTGALVPSISADQVQLINALNGAAVGEVRNIALENGSIILQVTGHKAPTTKYVAAVIKRSIAFSKDTRTATYNKFASFAAASKNGVEDMLAAAKKNNYTVQDLTNVSTSGHGIPDPGNPYGMAIPSSREALKWLFKADEGDISGLIECGQNRDVYVLLACTRINKDYLSMENPQVKEYVKAEALKDKQAAFIINKINGVKDINAAKAKGATISDVPQVTFAAPAVVAAVGNQPEPALSGAVAATKAGAFSSHPVKGNAGVYLFKVTSKANRQGVKFDAKTQQQKLQQQYMQYAGQFMNVLYQNAKVVDNRYLFF